MQLFYDKNVCAMFYDKKLEHTFLFFNTPPKFMIRFLLISNLSFKVLLFKVKQLTMPYFLINKFGAIQLTKVITSVGRKKNSDIHLMSLDCSMDHARIILRSDNSVVISNRSEHKIFFINDFDLLPNQKHPLCAGDIISFAGVESFKLEEFAEIPTIEIRDVF